jgi:hypothetical protein
MKQGFMVWNFPLWQHLGTQKVWASVPFLMLDYWISTLSVHGLSKPALVQSHISVRMTQFKHTHPWWIISTLHGTHASPLN